MKKMELSQMENLQGGEGGSGTAFACTMTVAGISTILGAATLGVGLFAGTLIAGAACGGAIGWGSASGDWW